MEGPNGNFEPIPPAIHEKLRVMQHDLRQLREHVAAGRVSPHDYAGIERVMAARIELLEAEVHARLLEESRRPSSAKRWN